MDYNSFIQMIIFLILMFLQYNEDNKKLFDMDNEDEWITPDNFGDYKLGIAFILAFALYCVYRLQLYLIFIYYMKRLFKDHGILKFIIISSSCLMVFSTSAFLLSLTKHFSNSCHNDKELGDAKTLSSVEETIENSMDSFMLEHNQGKCFVIKDDTAMEDICPDNNLEQEECPAFKVEEIQPNAFASSWGN